MVSDVKCTRASDHTLSLVHKIAIYKSFPGINSVLLTSTHSDPKT